MGWKKVTTNAIDIKKHKGESYVGVYKGSHQIDTKIGKQTIWEFVGEDGLAFGIYGFTNLNRALETVSEESEVRITYTGTENVLTKYGMKDVHQVVVEVNDVDEEKKVEVGKDGLPF